MRMAWAAGLLILTGCGTSTSWRSEEPPDRQLSAAPDREKEFADIPVPRGFTRQRGSYAYERGRFRICNLIYDGAPDPFRTVDFMLQQMGIAGWKLTDKALDNDQKVLSFVKGTETCRITVARFSSERKTQLTVTIGPAAGPAPAPAPVD